MVVVARRADFGGGCNGHPGSGCAVGSHTAAGGAPCGWVRRGVRRVTSSSIAAADQRRHTRGNVEPRFTERVHVRASAWIKAVTSLADSEGHSRYTGSFQREARPRGICPHAVDNDVVKFLSYKR